MTATIALRTSVSMPRQMVLGAMGVSWLAIAARSTGPGCTGVGRLPSSWPAREMACLARAYAIAICMHAVG
jgi:hypothetical protein